MGEFDAIVTKIENGWATITLKNNTVMDCWNFPRELREGDKLAFNIATRRWEIFAKDN